jgi:hypothetical protein
MTYKNKNRIFKTFQIGDLVKHQQKQVSTGTASSWKPIFQGPYKIIHFFDDKLTAAIKHIQTGQLVKAHFNNLELYNYNKEATKSKSNFLDEFSDQFSHKHLEQVPMIDTNEQLDNVVQNTVVENDANSVQLSPKKRKISPKKKKVSKITSKQKT